MSKVQLSFKWNQWRIALIFISISKFADANTTFSTLGIWVEYSRETLSFTRMSEVTSDTPGFEHIYKLATEINVSNKNGQFSVSGTLSRVIKISKESFKLLFSDANKDGKGKLLGDSVAKLEIAEGEMGTIIPKKGNAIKIGDVTTSSKTFRVTDNLEGFTKTSNELVNSLSGLAKVKEKKFGVTQEFYQKHASEIVKKATTLNNIEKFRVSFNDQIILTHGEEFVLIGNRGNFAGSKGAGASATYNATGGGAAISAVEGEALAFSIENVDPEFLEQVKNAKTSESSVDLRIKNVTPDQAAAVSEIHANRTTPAQTWEMEALEELIKEHKLAGEDSEKIKIVEDFVESAKISAKSQTTSELKTTESIAQELIDSKGTIDNVNDPKKTEESLKNNLGLKAENVNRITSYVSKNLSKMRTIRWAKLKASKFLLNNPKLVGTTAGVAAGVVILFEAPNYLDSRTLIINYTEEDKINEALVELEKTTAMNVGVGLAVGTMLGVLPALLTYMGASAIIVSTVTTGGIILMVAGVVVLSVKAYGIYQDYQSRKLMSQLDITFDGTSIYECSIAGTSIGLDDCAESIEIFGKQNIMGMQKNSRKIKSTDDIYGSFIKENFSGRSIGCLLYAIHSALIQVKGVSKEKRSKALIMNFYANSKNDAMCR